ncbi:Arabinose efflux permease [Vibrio campbellii]|uniref:MFS transporter n=1 Tax=Vibrio campbellii TaxID=680 RepID=UPI0005311DC6|nr:MFS transporter [Vibrio campbellii]ARR08105.1 MFS transporter [Vibrio campbellii]KGR37495.1 Arabinose efflux permease [Vibrio campbellii]
MNKIIYLPITFLAFLQGGFSLLSLYLYQSGIDQESISMMLPFMGIGGLLGGIFGGVSSDRSNPKKVLIIMAIPWLFIPALISQNNMLVQVCAIFLIGMSLAGCRSVILYIITSQRNKDHINHSLSIRRIIINLCVAIGSGMMGFIISQSNDFYVMYLLFFGLATFASIAIYKVDMNKLYVLDVIESRKSRSQSLYLLSIISITLSLICFSFIPVYYTIYIVSEKQFPTDIAGYIFTFSGVIIVLFQVKLSALTKNIDIHYRVISGVLLLSLGTFSVKYISDYAGLALSVSAWTLGEMLLFVPAVQFILEYTTSKKGKTISVYQSLFSVSDFIAPILGGAVIAFSFSYIWDISLALGITSSVIILIIKQKCGVKNESYQY